MVRLLLFLFLFCSPVAHAMEWSEQLSLSARGFCAGCVAGIVQNKYTTPNLICAISVHDICDQYCKENPSRIQLVSYEVPAYFLGSVCGMRIRRFIPKTCFRYTKQRVSPLIVAILGLNLTYEE